MNTIRTIDFDLAGDIAIDDLAREEKFAERFRASYYVGKFGAVVVTGVQINDARIGKPANWQPTHLPRFLTLQIERMIEADILEQRAIA